MAISTLDPAIYDPPTTANPKALLEQFGVLPATMPKPDGEGKSRPPPPEPRTVLHQRLQALVDASKATNCEIADLVTASRAASERICHLTKASGDTNKNICELVGATNAIAQAICHLAERWCGTQDANGNTEQKSSPQSALADPQLSAYRAIGQVELALLEADPTDPQKRKPKGKGLFDDLRANKPVRDELTRLGQGEAWDAVLADFSDTTPADVERATRLATCQKLRTRVLSEGRPR